MKTYAKLITLVITIILIGSLFGCAAQPTETAAPVVTEAPQPTAVPPTEVPPTEVPPTAVPPAPTEVPPEPVTLRYANWNLGTEEENNIQRQLIKAYTDLNPNVTVQLVDKSDPNGQGWDALLTGYAAKGELPDVFMANNVPLYVQNGWLADLSEFVKDDADWANVPQALKNVVTYSDAIKALPAAQFIMGYWVNQDLYEANNLDAPYYGMPVDEFFSDVKAMNNIPQGQLGLDEQEFVMSWFASTQDSMLGYNSFDGEHMNYNSTAFKDAVAQAYDMLGYTWQGLTDEQKANFKSTGPWELFMNQEVGVRWDASWSVPSYVQNATFNWDFVGIPGGNQALVFDAMVVSDTSANKEAAYDFAKWMTFSKAAYLKEAELAKAMNSAPKLPVSVDDESIALYKTFVDKPGVNEALANLDNSLIESLAKVIPGYIQARWEGKPGIDIGENKDVNVWFILNEAISGRIKYEDYSAQLEEFANKILDDAKAQLNP
jgi:ABC-type glycerol-3-phosphate transport system substrate-binding protein